MPVHISSFSSDSSEHCLIPSQNWSAGMEISLSSQNLVRQLKICNYKKLLSNILLLGILTKAANVKPKKRLSSIIPFLYTFLNLKKFFESYLFLHWTFQYYYAQSYMAYICHLGLNHELYQQLNYHFGILHKILLF